MLGHWTIFEGTPGGVKREQRRVTLGMNKTISLNKVAYEELGKPIAIELRFDRNLKRIGLKSDESGVQKCFSHQAEKEFALPLAGRRSVPYTFRHYYPMHGSIRRRHHRQRRRDGAR